MHLHTQRLCLPNVPVAPNEPTDPQNADFSSYPLFFSTWDEEGNPVENHTTLGGGRKPKTFWDVAREKGWMDGWKPETEDEARQR
ncbi:hypothetical protein CALVIDRAFT_290703 [Calocera viscosa TUFC12733]|uniref:Uncharacterized protein n=1 Tax=Calocera viscosa (strain TUFC12733) TaxID=1330018 RepID=A0A167IS44_CALVF|nr:hypothetical protein CALVIDRAFT_290703 [Calocera viscosa TUFC12733]